MGEVIEFKIKNRSRSKEEADRRVGLKEGWTLHKVASTTEDVQSPYKYFTSANDYFRDDLNLTMYSLYDPDDDLKATFVFNEEEYRIAKIVTDYGSIESEAYSVLAKLCATQKWTVSFRWIEGFVFDEMGIVYSVNAMPDGITINGSIRIENNPNVQLPNNLRVKRDIYIRNSTITKHPKMITCEDIYVVGCQSLKLSERIDANDINITMSSIDKISDAAHFKGNAYFKEIGSPLYLPTPCVIEGNLIVVRSEINMENGPVVVKGKLTEEYDGKHELRFGLDHAERLLNRNSMVRIRRYPSENEDFQFDWVFKSDVLGKFLHANKDGSYTCEINENGRRSKINVNRKEVLATYGSTT